MSRLTGTVSALRTLAPRVLAISAEWAEAIGWHGDTAVPAGTTGCFGARTRCKGNSRRHYEIPLPNTLDLGHFAMQTTRFWVGAIALTVVAAGILIATSGSDRIESGPVQGRVTYNGRPVTGGAILFISEDRRRSDDRWFWIDRSGHYECGTDWRRGRSARRSSTFAWSWTPASTRRGCSRRDLPARGCRLRTDGLSPWLGRGGGPAPIAMPVVYPAARPPGPPTANTPATARHFGNPNTTELAVHLGPEPAIINVDLTD